MTPAERQRARKARLEAAALEASSKPQEADTDAILRGLSLTLATLADPTKGQYHAGSRFAAERAIYELCQRFKLTPRPAPTGKK